MSKILYNDSYCIGIEQLNKINFLLLTTADCIYINEHIEINWQLSPKDYQHVKNSIEQFYKNGLIKYWGFPQLNHKNTDCIILDEKLYEYNCEVINKTFLDKKNIREIVNMLNTGELLIKAPEENTSKILLIRRILWTYAILSILKVDQVLTKSPDWIPEKNKILKSSDDSDENFILKTCLSNSKVSQLSQLSPADILALHKKNANFRKQLDQLLNNRDIDFKKEALSAEMKLLQERKKRTNELVLNSGETILSVVINWIPFGNILNQFLSFKNIGKNMLDVQKLRSEHNSQKTVCSIIIEMANSIVNKLK